MEVTQKIAEVAESSSQLFPGLPEHLAMECLARVPLATLQGASKAWQKLIYDSYFQSLRTQVGSPELKWIYTLVQTKDMSFKWRAYDPLSSRWHELPPVPHPMEFQLSNPGCIGVSYTVQCVSTRNRLVMLAGMKVRNDGQARVTLEPALDHPLIFDTCTSVWKRGAPFRVPRKWCVCGAVDEKVFVASGSGKDWDRDLSKSVEVYDLDKDSWQALENLSSSKFSGEAMHAVTVGDKLCFVSGRGVFAKEGAVYDIAKGSWTDMPPGLRGGWRESCVAVDGRMYMLEAGSMGRLKVYVPETDEWEVALVDSRLQNLEISVGTTGKIVGIVTGRNVYREGSLLRVVDVTSEVPKIFDIPVHDGNVVSVHILSMMRSQQFSQ